MRTITLIIAALLGLGPGAASPSPHPQQTAEAAGLTLETLSAEDLNDIQAQTGRRWGVEITSVRPGSPGAQAGLRDGDIITAVNGTGVDSAARAAALIKAAPGEAVLSIISINIATFQLESKMARLRAGTSPSPPSSANDTPSPPASAGPPASIASRPGAGDPVGAYFDLLDFSCTQAWGRPVATPAADRQRVAALLLQGWRQMDAATQAQIAALPRAWADLQQSWKAMKEPERARKREEWRDQILLPNNAFAPPASVARFAAEGNLVAFEYPSPWTGGWQVIDGTPFLFVGPGGAQASWDKVLNTSVSPPGALFALVNVDARLRSMSFVQGARFLVQLLMPGAAGSFKEVQITPIGQVGAILTLRGRFPGQSEERFYWIGITSFGGNQVFAGRMGGPVAQAMDLLPGFHHILSTLQLTPPAASGGGEAYGAWTTAWSKVSTAIVADIWKR